MYHIVRDRAISLCRERERWTSRRVTLPESRAGAVTTHAAALEAHCSQAPMHDRQVNFQDLLYISPCSILFSLYEYSSQSPTPLTLSTLR